MGRNLGPSCRRCRRLGESVCGKAKCAVIKRNYPPGQAGVRTGQKRLTQYGLQLREKQKAKWMYGILERQFRNYYKKASRKSGNTGELILQMLELRLDNVAYRAGFATTRSQARQLVTHGHFIVNGVRCDIPSRQVEVGDSIELRPKSQKSKYFEQNDSEMKMYEPASWLTVDRKNWKVTVDSIPQIKDFEPNIEIHLIVEFYSR